MNIGIKEIGSYIPTNYISITEDLFDGLDKNFIETKLGFHSVTRKEDSHETSDLCVFAYKNLQKKINFKKEDIQCIILCTQNPDSNGLPHTSAIIHKKLEFNDNCATFDISLGCSGYVYGLSIIKSFMTANNFTNGLLFTCDPYSKVIDKHDKNTSILFGDAASVTLINNTPRYTFNDFSFGTNGSLGNAIQKNNNNILEMNGRAVFNFTATKVPESILQFLDNFNLTPSEIDLFILHQGSKFIVDTINKKLGICSDKSPFKSAPYGNTVSSSIPIILEEYLSSNNSKILLSGFGVGLSWATTYLERYIFDEG